MQKINRKKTGVIFALCIGVAAIAHATVIGTVQCGQSCNANLSSGTPASGLPVEHNLDAFRNNWLATYNSPIPEDGIQIQICGGGGCGLYEREPDGEWVVVDDEA